ncbi:MAG: S41 family peptidase [Acetobacteraceae bacterium]
MIRRSVLLFLVMFGGAQAQSAPEIRFDSYRVTSVYAEALAFMAPRILEPVTVPQMAIWGLRGITALDPMLTVTLRDGFVKLANHNRVIFETPAPKDATPVAWANTAAVMASAGYNVSPAIRRAGSQGIIQSFFDELFNHLDPYSRYVAPVEAGEDRARRSGRAGLGVTVAQRGSAIVIESVIRDSPADQVGIQPADVLLAVDRQPLRGATPQGVAAMLDGPEDTGVVLTWRSKDGRVREAEAVRAMVPPDTVFTERDGSFLSVRVTGFSRSTDRQLALVLRDALLQVRLLQGIVLDLRGNRGGLLRQAVATADELLPPGIVAMTQGRAPEANHVWRSTAGQLARAVPVVVIVDGRTASAAEVLAAALADRGRAVVVGSSTLGKGLVQTIDPLPDGGELFVTWSRILAPLGWPIHDLGVLPQVCTSRGQEVLHRQMAELAKGVQSFAKEIRAHRAARAPLTPAQVLAIRSTCPAAEGREADMETARVLLSNPAAYAAALLPPIMDGR